jgi:Cof subfamily protein (haloacid dehalogenase superfamily)
MEALGQEQPHRESQDRACLVVFRSLGSMYGSNFTVRTDAICMTKQGRGNKRVPLEQGDFTTIELLAVDIDGTLLDSNRRIRPGVLKALRSTLNDGLTVCLVTGRPRCGTLPLLEQLGLTSPDITSGGAFIFDPEKAHVVAYRPVPPESTRVVVEIARRPDVGIFFGSPESIVYEVPFEDFHRSSTIDPRYLRRTDDLLTETDLQPGKITLVAELPILKELEEQIQSIRQPLHITYSGDRYLEINHESASKGSALEQLSGYMQVPLDAIMAVGDSLNDLSMFQVAGISVAMGNASEEVRKNADLIAPTNDEDGLAWAIRQIR